MSNVILISLPACFKIPHLSPPLVTIVSVEGTFSVSSSYFLDQYVVFVDLSVTVTNKSPVGFIVHV